MKKILLSVITISFLSLNAQIFINTNPNTKTTETSTTKTEVKTTTTEAKETVNNGTIQVKEEVKTVVPTTTTVVTEKTEEVKEVVPTTTTATTVKTVTPVTTTKVETVVPAATTVTTAKPVTTSYSSYNAVANINEDVPPNAQPGKCYARCLVEDKFSFVNEQVVDQPTLIKKVKVPALYKTVHDTVVLSPATTKTIQHPAEYETVKEEVMVTPATTKWVKGKADAGCLSANPADCQVMCLVEVPAVYKTITKKVITKEAFTSNSTVPMQFKIVTREVKVQDEKLVDVVTPATYKTVQKRVLQQKGGYEVWREILCGDDLTTQKILDIQKALKAKGYNPGPIDNVFGSQTKAALIQYQKDKGLPIGNLNLETLRSLGVN